MNPDSPQFSRDLLEARLTALLLGELTPAEEAEVRHAIAQDPELSRLHDHIKATIPLLREAMAASAAPAVEPTALRLSEDRRQRLLRQFKIIAPKELASPRWELPGWLVPAGIAAAIVLLLAAISIPNFVRARESGALNTVANNLRILEGAKEQYALENKLGPEAPVTLNDLKPYLKGGLPVQPTLGETYSIAKVGDLVTAEGRGLRGKTTVESFGADPRAPSDRSRSLASAVTDREAEVRRRFGVRTAARPMARADQTVPAPAASTDVSQQMVERYGLRPRQTEPGARSQQLAEAASTAGGRTATRANTEPAAAPAKGSIYLPAVQETEAIGVPGQPAGQGLTQVVPADASRALSEGDSQIAGNWVSYDNDKDGNLDLFVNRAETSGRQASAGDTTWFYSNDGGGAGGGIGGGGGGGFGDSAGITPEGVVNGRTDLAAAGAESQKQRAGALVQDGKRLYEMGRLAEAEARLKSAAASDPSNQAAYHYSKLVAEARYQNGARDREVMNKDKIVEMEKAWLPPTQREAFPATPTAAPIAGGRVVTEAAEKDNMQLGWVRTASGAEPSFWDSQGRAPTPGGTAAPAPPDAAGVSSVSAAGYTGTAAAVMPPAAAATEAPATREFFAEGDIPAVQIEAKFVEYDAPADRNFALAVPTTGTAAAAAAAESAKVPVLGDLPVLGQAFRPERLNEAAGRAAADDKVGKPVAYGKKSGVATVTNAVPVALGFEAKDSQATPLYDVAAKADGTEPTAGQSREALHREVREKEVAQVVAKLDAVATGISALGAAAPAQQPAPDAGLAPLAQAEARVLSRPMAEAEPAQERVASTAPVDSKRRELLVAKQELENQRKIRDAVKLRVLQETTDASIPKSSIVEITDPAEAQPAQRPSLWKRIGTGLTGEVERSARVSVEKDVSQINPLGFAQVSSSFDPDFVETESQKIKSKKVLDSVIDKLKLDEAWAEKAGVRGKLGRDETIALLSKRLSVEQGGSPTLLDIRVKSDQPEEAARIANTIAEVYRDERLDSQKEQAGRGAQALAKKLAEQDKELARAEERLTRLEKESAAEPADVTPPKPATAAPIPQPEVPTSANPFSTFSLNVSDVSFKLAASSLENGTMPDPAGIRTEEFINAFDYHDPEPAPGLPFAFAWERARTPFAHNRDLLRLSLQTAARGREPGRPLNLVLLLDNSGSMERADRVAIIREALRVLAGQLQPQDKVSVVAFSRTPRLWIDGLPGAQAGELVERVGNLTPQGGTNLEDALRLAYETAARHYLANGVNRVVLLTDGAANLGDVDPESLKQKVESNRKQGIALDCFGIGWEGYNDDLLEVLSRNGDGRYGFVNTPEEAAAGFANQLAGALQVAAADVKVQVEFNPQRVTAWRQIGYAKHQLTKEQFRDNTVDAAEIGAAESGNALYTMEVNPRGEGPLGMVRARFKVPTTGEYREFEWELPYQGEAAALDASSPAMRLAGTAAAFSEWLASSPFAAEVTPDELLKLMAGVPEVFGADERPKKLEWMVRQAKSLAGK